MTDLITTDLVRLGADWGQDKHDVIRALAAVVDDAGRATDKDQLVEDAFARESTSATGLPGGIAIPHCRTSGVETPDPRLRPARPAGRLRRQGRSGRHGLPDRRSGRRRRRPPDDPDQARPRAGQARLHRRAPLRGVGRRGRRPDHPRDRRARPGAQAGRCAASAAAATAAGPRPPPPRRLPPSGAKPSLVAVTACPTGIAHTYMAAEALEAAAERAGVDLQVETQGSAGSTPLAPATIAAAGAVIFAVDVGVRDRSRFAGKPMVSSGVKRPIDDADAMIAEALRYAADPSSAPRVEGTASEAGRSPRAASSRWAPRPAGS